MVLKEVKHNYVSLGVACDSIPLVSAGVAHIPVLVVPPEVSIHAQIKVFQSSELPGTRVYRTSVHVASRPVIIDSVLNARWLICYVAASLIYVRLFHKRAIWIVNPDNYGLSRCPSGVQMELQREGQVEKLQNEVQTLHSVVHRGSGTHCERLIDHNRLRDDHLARLEDIVHHWCENLLVTFYCVHKIYDRTARQGRQIVLRCI